MVFYKDIEVRTLQQKYGGDYTRALFANEKILPGELIWYCECGEEDDAFTRDQLMSIMNNRPKLENFIRSFSYMIDDDLFAMPPSYTEEKNNDECALFNHSCNPNCGFEPNSNGNGICAIRTIEPGEELTYHYGFLETEASLIYGMECKCGSSNCEKNIMFDHYRDDEFVTKYLSFFTPYLKKKFEELKEKWHNDNSYVKRVPSTERKNVEEWEKCLFSVKDIKRDELIASFSTDEIFVDKHFLRHSTKANCYVKDRNVFANVDIPSESELTIYYHGVLL
jgi:hypothetical protein